jgi:hypothetical protein
MGVVVAARSLLPGCYAAPLSLDGSPLRGTPLLNFLKTVSNVTPLLRQAVKHQPCLQSGREAPSPFTLLRLPETLLNPIGHIANLRLRRPGIF